MWHKHFSDPEKQCFCFPASELKNTVSLGWVVTFFLILLICILKGVIRPYSKSVFFRQPESPPKPWNYNSSMLYVLCFPVRIKKH